MDFGRFEILTFDCYGTLIDWEAGILGALRPLLARHGIDETREPPRFSDTAPREERPDGRGTSPPGRGHGSTR